MPTGVRSLALAVGLLLARDACAAQGSTAERFVLSLAFAGKHAFANLDADRTYKGGMLNAFSFWHPLDPGMPQFMARHRAGLLFTMAAATRVEGSSATYIEKQRDALAAFTRSSGAPVFWNLMEEWDQGGGRWVGAGRPRYTGLDRGAALQRFTRHYLDASPPLGMYLREPRNRRAVPLLAQTDHGINAFYAFEMGVDACMLERGVDELGDIATGVAFVRGAARQFGREWGIDLSLWRTSADSATEFDARGNLKGGWSPSYVRRHLFVSFLAGARLVQVEPARYFDQRGHLNPLGSVIREFAEFALQRHPDVGRAVVSTAIVIPHASGFVPKHWVYGQGDAVWYGDIAYSDGDRVLNALLRLAYPDHWLHGLAPGAPFADSNGAPRTAEFKRYLEAGGDPRPFEPMPSTRWGQGLDVITDQASPETLRPYTVVVLTGNVLRGALREALRTWVANGGTLVATARQVTEGAEELFGARLARAESRADRSRWLGDGTVYDEPLPVAARVEPITATVLATTGGGAPLVTSNAVGKGRAIVIAADLGHGSARDRLPRVVTRLLDELQARVAPARVDGGRIQYVVTRSATKTVVSLVNNAGSTWHGSVIWNEHPSRPFALKEYLTDTTVGHRETTRDVTITAEVPPYDVRVYALETR